MPLEQGKQEKLQILHAYKINRFLEEVEESNVQAQVNILNAADAYARSRSRENADKLYDAVCRTKFDVG